MYSYKINPLYIYIWTSVKILPWLHPCKIKWHLVKVMVWKKYLQKTSCRILVWRVTHPIIKSTSAVGPHYSVSIQELRHSGKDQDLDVTIKQKPKALKRFTKSSCDISGTALISTANATLLTHCHCYSLFYITCGLNWPPQIILWSYDTLWLLSHLILIVCSWGRRTRHDSQCERFERHVWLTRFRFLFRIK